MIFLIYCRRCGEWGGGGGEGAALAQDPRAWVPFAKSLSGTNWDLPSGPVSLFVN